MRAPLLPWYPLRLWHWVIWSFVGGAVLLSAALVEVFCTWAIGLILRLKFVSCGLMVFSIRHEAASKSSPHMALRMRSKDNHHNRYYRPEPYKELDTAACYSRKGVFAAKSLGQPGQGLQWRIGAGAARAKSVGVGGTGGVGRGGVWGARARRLDLLASSCVGADSARAGGYPNIGRGIVQNTACFACTLGCILDGEAGGVRRCPALQFCLHY